MKKPLLLLSILYFFSYAQDSYELGSGLQLGNTPLYVGGYFSSDYTQKQDAHRYRLDDIALLSYGGSEKLNYMLELEFKDFYSHTYDEGEVSVQKDWQLHYERIYLDYNFNENYTLRMGKYNSPIGFWNMLPINVLRETTSNPMTSTLLFPRFTTGLGVNYNTFKEGELHVNLMLQHNQALDDSYNNYALDEHYAFGISYSKNSITLKLNGGAFNDDKNSTDTTKTPLYYALFSAKYESEKVQLLTEVGTQYSDKEVTTPYAAYLQGLYRLSEKHIAIARFESYEDRRNNLQDNIAIFGYTYRPLYPIAFKGEYQLHSKKDANSFIFSFSVLF